MFLSQVYKKKIGRKTITMGTNRTVANWCGSDMKWKIFSVLAKEGNALSWIKSFI